MRLRLVSGSFRRQLTLTIVIAVSVLVVAVSLVTAVLMAKRLAGGLIKEATLLTGQFADQSVLAFLVDDPSVAEQTLAAVEAFPAIEYVGILDTEFKRVASRGAPVSWGPLAEGRPVYDRAQLAMDDDAHWHFVAPVDTEVEASPLGQAPRASQRLGYLHVAVEKSPLFKLIRTIVLSNFLIALLVAVLLILWLFRRMRRLTDPLSGLTAVMLKAGQSGKDIRANISGPDEVKDIARVFNDLMERLQKYQASLESEVAIRTEEARAARDAALTAERHKSEFMAAITHEMRAPLQAITGYVQHTISELEFVKDAEFVGEAKEYQRIVLSEANDLLSRINQILDLARVEAGKLEVNCTATDLRALLRDVEETVQPLATQNGNTLALEHEGIDHIVTDEDKLKQILLNVMSNACKFTHDGEVLLQSSCDSERLRVIVRDTGIGIPEPEQEVVFEAFRQVDMSNTRKYKGTGLGLALTQRFCELLGGEVSLSSVVGQGTEVRITLPCSLASADKDIDSG